MRRRRWKWWLRRIQIAIRLIQILLFSEFYLPGENSSLLFRPVEHHSLVTLVLSCMVTIGIQFGWALQYSHIQTPGIGHAFSSFFWPCGVDLLQRLWFNLVLVLGVTNAFQIMEEIDPFFIWISRDLCCWFSVDIGYLLGDTKEHCRTFRGTRTRAAFVFVVGFWLLDLANKTVQITYCVPFSVTAKLTAESSGGQDDCITWFGSLGCSLWRRLCTCLCSGFPVCPGRCCCCHSQVFQPFSTKAFVSSGFHFG